MEYDPTRMCELLVGLGDVEVLGIDDKEGAPLRVRIRRRVPRPPCGGCGGLLWSDGERPVALVDLPAFGRPVRLVWHKRRWRCPRGGCEAGSATEQAAEIAPARALLTARAARWATRQAGRGRPLKDVAAELGCVWHTVNSAVRRWGAALLDADTERISRVSALGLDEHLMMRRGRFRTKTWGTSIVDVGRGQLLDIVRGRTAKAPTRWLLGRPRGRRAGIRWAVLGPLGPLPGRVQRRGAQSPTGRGPVVRWLAVVASVDGTILERVPNPAPLKQALKTLRRLQRRLARSKLVSPDGSNRQTELRSLISHAHADVAAVRRDAMHKLTTRLAKTHGVVVVEDLNVQGMLRKTGLPGGRARRRGLADAALGEFRRQMTYKCDWYGSDLIVADRWFPSSQTCHVCHHRQKIGWAAAWTCGGCGSVHDRDDNAAVNLAQYEPDPEGGWVLAGPQQSCGCGVCSPGERTERLRDDETDPAPTTPAGVGQATRPGRAAVPLMREEQSLVQPREGCLNHV